MSGSGLHNHLDIHNITHYGYIEVVDEYFYVDIINSTMVSDNITIIDISRFNNYTIYNSTIIGEVSYKSVIDITSYGSAVDFRDSYIEGDMEIGMGDTYNTIHTFYRNTMNNSIISIHGVYQTINFSDNDLYDSWLKIRDGGTGEFAFLNYEYSSGQIGRIDLLYQDSSTPDDGYFNLYDDNIGLKYNYKSNIYDADTVYVIENISDSIQFGSNWVNVINDSGFNEPATITFKNIVNPNVINILKDNEYCFDCENISYGIDSVQFDVSGFSNYSYEKQYSAYSRIDFT